MKNKKLFLLPIFMLLLAGCGGTSTPSASDPNVSEPSVSEATSDSEEDLPSASEPDIPEVDLTTIENARKVSGREVNVEGTITAIFGMASGTHAVIIQQGDFAITLVFIQKTISATLAVGDAIRAFGQVDIFNGLVQLKDTVITKLTADKAETIVPLVLEEADWTTAYLGNKDGRLVRVDGLKYASGVINTTANSEIVVNLGAKRIPIYMSNYIDMAEKEALKAKFDAIKSSDDIQFLGPVGFYDKPQLNPINADTVIITEGAYVEPSKPLSLVFDPAEVEVELGATHQAVPKPTPADALLDGLAWASGDVGVATVSESGLITATGYGETTVTAKIGVLTARLLVVVPDPNAPLPVYTLDLSKESAQTYSSKPSSDQYYNYDNEYDIKITDGTTEMAWGVYGFNPNFWSVPGSRFGGRTTQPKLSTMDNKPAAATKEDLIKTYAVSQEKIMGEVKFIEVTTIGTFESAFLENVYVQASSSADFSTDVIDVGHVKMKPKAKVLIEGANVLTDMYYRVIFGIAVEVTSNSGVIVSNVTFLGNRLDA